MRNIRLHIEYDGQDFCGWQRQPEAPSIQAHLEDCLTKVTGRKTIVYGSSRTDSGVHARGQIANFYVDPSVNISPDRWSRVLNFMLPRSIRILDSREAPPTFHSQKRVAYKIYEYRILNRIVASALDRRALFYPRPLEWEKIRQSLPYFKGRQDFRAFQGAKSTVKTTIRTIHEFELHQEYEGLYCFRIKGSGFLKQMVRTMIGTVLEVGERKREPETIPGIFASRDRNQAGRTVPGHGLCLVEIRYLEDEA